MPPLVRTIYIPQRLPRASNPHTGDSNPNHQPANSPVLEFPPQDKAASRAGEIVLTDKQKLALLVMRGSDLSKRVLAGVIEQTRDGPHGRDFYTCARLGMAINKGRFHVLTPKGRWYADRIAHEVARQFGLHIISYDHGSVHDGRGAFAKCSCGWRGLWRSRAIASWPILIGHDAHLHLEKTAAKGITP